MNAFDTSMYNQNMLIVLSAVFGLALGSFLNVVICRLPGGGRAFFVSVFSRCPHCGARIRWFDNIPLLSYLLLRGRCRACTKRISIQYPLVELAMAAVSVWLFQVYGSAPLFFIYIAFFGILLAISVIDLNRQWIPDSLVFIGCGIGIAGSLVTPLPGWTNAMAGLVFGVTVPLMLVSAYEMLRRKEVMGGGDFKLIGMIGAFLGWQPLGAIVFYSALLGTLFAVGMKLADHPTRLPFAPFLTLGTLYTLFGPDLFHSCKALL